MGVRSRVIDFIFLFTFLLLLILCLEITAVEETERERRFGEDYRSCKKRVPVFSPWKRPAA
ncbi:MAG: hypothetical protein JW950_01335 [Deltaproteobacteria bacterium]|nr:hypothetical protein [Deltaproteobacteria bacterium]